MQREFDVIILGGGAAGLICAVEAGKRRRRVAVLERNGRIGKKILISGGGRCNFTNIHCRPEHFISGNPHFAKSALAPYTPYDFIALAAPVRDGSRRDLRALKSALRAALPQRLADRWLEANPPQGWTNRALAEF